MNNAKEKAEQLMKYFDFPKYDKEKNIVFTFNHFTIEQKKYCILKGIDEIIESVNDEHISDIFIEFCEEVKNEIEKL
jgi:hypothetical protein